MVGMPTVDQHWPNVGMMLALCPQHWPDVGAGGHWYVGPTSHQWLADGWPIVGPTLACLWGYDQPRYVGRTVVLLECDRAFRMNREERNITFNSKIKGC